MWLPWDVAALVAVCLAVVGRVGQRMLPPRTRFLSVVAAVAWESAIVLGLYALWQRAGDFTVTRTTGAVDHARWIWHAERLLHLPSEVTIQRAVLPHPLVVRSLNIFYEGAHVPGLIIFLIWLFARHRDRFAYWRNVGALLTGASLLIQMIPVAPPRLLPGLGFVDTAVVYGQSVYGPGGIRVAPQLAAMPSVHVGWAVFIALALVVTSKSRWRWAVLGHPVLTVLTVVATANHWWLDGIVAAALLPLALLVERSARSVRPRARQQPAVGQVAVVVPDYLPAASRSRQTSGV